MRESAIENYLIKKCKQYDYITYKFLSFTNGVPDRIIIGPNKDSKYYNDNQKVIFIELKAPGKKPRKLQQKIINDMIKSGASVIVIDKKEQIDNLFYELLKKGEY